MPITKNLSETISQVSYYHTNIPKFMHFLAEVFHDDIEKILDDKRDDSQNEMQYDSVRLEQLNHISVTSPVKSKATFFQALEHKIDISPIDPVIVELSDGSRAKYRAIGYKIRFELQRFKLYILVDDDQHLVVEDLKNLESLISFFHYCRVNAPYVLKKLNLVGKHISVINQGDEAPILVPKSGDSVELPTKTAFSP